MFCVEEQPLDLSVKPQKCDGYDSYISSSQHFNFEWLDHRVQKKNQNVKLFVFTF